MNWLTNAQVAYNLFNQKLGNIRTIQNTANTSNHKPQYPLTQFEVENMALLEYNGAANPKNPGAQYCTVQCVGGTGTSCSGGHWQWMENKSYRGKKTYAEKVRGVPAPTSYNCY